MSSLFEINASLALAIENSIDPETGEILNMKLVEDLDLEFDDKAKSITFVIKTKEHAIEAIKIEEARLKALRDSTKKQMENLKKYLLVGMQLADRPSLDLGTVRVSIRNNTPSLILSDDLSSDLLTPVKLQEELLKSAKSDFSEQKKAIKDGLKSGGEFAGAHLEYKKSIIIK